jgi:hypothetical protein
MTFELISRLRTHTVSDSAEDIYSTMAQAAETIEKLQEQVRLAHSILSSEGVGWLMSGSAHEESWRDMLEPSIVLYWEKYGSYFKPQMSKLPE